MSPEERTTREKVLVLEEKQAQDRETLIEIKADVKSIDKKFDRLVDSLQMEKTSTLSSISDLRAKFEGIKSKVLMLSAGVSLALGIIVKFFPRGGS